MLVSTPCVPRVRDLLGTGYPAHMHTTSGTSLWLDRPSSAAKDILPADGRFDDLVVGAGLTGLTTALLLARAGRRVGVLEAREIGSVTTGHTTAKVSLLQGTKLSTILRRQPRHVAEAYVDANREGMEWLLRFCSDHDVDFQRRDALTYAATPDEVATVRREHDAAKSVGLPVAWSDALDLPFPAYGATVLAEQAQLHPMELLDALVQQLRLHGGTVHEGQRVVGVGRSGNTVRLESGEELKADHVVLATGTPILDRGLHFAMVEPKRSYLLAYTGIEAPLPMCISAGSSSRSVRDVPSGHVLVGGSGHTVGRTSSEAAHLDELRRWARGHFPDAVETHAWSAQDYAPFDGVPIVGRLPLSSGHAFVATGYNKWGMTNAIAAAHTISAEILGGKTPGLRARPLHPAALLEAGRLNTCVALELARGGLGGPRCTHLGGRLSWNDAEESWDCPLHGSRFDKSGEVLEGPATKPLSGRNHHE